MTQMMKTQEQIAQKAREAWAEQLPICEMLSRGYLSCGAPRNFPSVDSFVFRLDEHAIVTKTARIQSKYTSRNDTSGIPLDRLGFDFLVIIRDTIKAQGRGNRAHTQIYVIPEAEVRRHWKGKTINFNDLSTKFLWGSQKKTDVWQSVVNFLESK